MANLLSLFFYNWNIIFFIFVCFFAMFWLYLFWKGVSGYLFKNYEGDKDFYIQLLNAQGGDVTIGKTSTTRVLVEDDED